MSEVLALSGSNLEYLDNRLSRWSSRAATADSQGLSSADGCHSIEIWCVGTRYEWSALFSQWLSALCLKRQTPVAALQQFVEEVTQRLPEAQRAVVAFEKDVKQQEQTESASQYQARLCQLRQYLKSITKRRDLAAKLTETNPDSAVYAVVCELAGSEVDFPPPASWSFKSPNSRQVFAQCAVAWLVHDLVFWYQELQQEAGPWVNATSYHHDLLNSIQTAIYTFREVAASVPATAGDPETVRAELIFSYLYDEVNSLKHLASPAMIKVRPYSEPPESPASFMDLDADREEIAKKCLKGYIRPLVGERLRSAIQLLNSFMAPSDVHEGLFIPRIQWIFVIANSTSIATGNAGVELPEEVADLFSELSSPAEDFQSTEVEFDGTSNLTIENCESLRYRYATFLDSWFAAKADQLISHADSGGSECLSEEVRRITRVGKRVAFREDLMAELSARLRIGIGSLSEVFDALHFELVLLTKDSDYERPWGRLKFDSEKGLILLAKTE